MKLIIDKSRAITLARPYESDWKYFSLDSAIDKIPCSCCGIVIVNELFFLHMALLDRMRDELGFPIYINSGHRCPRHNRNVGGALPNPETGRMGSWHLRFATDIRPGNGNPANLALMYAKAKALGFAGIGRANTFLHVDLRPDPVEWRY